MFTMLGRLGGGNKKPGLSMPTYKAGWLIPGARGLGVPVLVSQIPTLNLTQNALMSPEFFSVYFTGAATYEISVTPPGCTFSTTTGILSGTPTTLATTATTITGTNKAGSTVSNSFDIVVSV